MGEAAADALICCMVLIGACVPAGCGMDELACDLYSSVSGEDSAHCFQWIAVQNSDTDECEKVQSGNWAGSGQNPPKDKCYLMSAI